MASLELVAPPLAAQGSVKVVAILLAFSCRVVHIPDRDGIDLGCLGKTSDTQTCFFSTRACWRERDGERRRPLRRVRKPKKPDKCWSWVSVRDPIGNGQDVPDVRTTSPRCTHLPRAWWSSITTGIVFPDHDTC